MPLQGSEITTSPFRQSRVIYDAVYNPSVLTLKHPDDQLEFMRAPEASVHVNVPDGFTWNTKFNKVHDALVATSIRLQKPWESGTWDFSMGAAGSPAISFNGVPQAFDELKRQYGEE